MKLTIKYFASIRETIGVSQEVVEVDTTQITVDGLRSRLATRSPDLAEALHAKRPVRVAVNHEMVGGSFVVRQDSEVAFFPPVTGG